MKIINLSFSLIFLFFAVSTFIAVKQYFFSAPLDLPFLLLASSYIFGSLITITSSLLGLLSFIHAIH